MKLHPREWSIEDPKTNTQHKVSAGTPHISFRVASELVKKELKKFPKVKLLHAHAANGNTYFIKL